MAAAAVVYPHQHGLLRSVASEFCRGLGLFFVFHVQQHQDFLLLLISSVEARG
jgi:hypothetical protein